MKIIKAGVLPETRVLQTTCSNCKCVFEFSVSEARTIHDQRDGTYYEIKCPTCDKSVYVNP